MKPLSPRAIAVLDDCVPYGYDPGEDEHQVQCWIDQLNAASVEFHRTANREFVSKEAERPDPNADEIDVPVETRYFDLDEWIVDERCLDVGDLAEAPTAVRLTQLDGTLEETVTLATLVYLPRNPEPWQPIEELWFRPNMAGSAGLSRTYICEVEGRWGFPELPDDLVTACAKQAAIWFARDITQYSTTFRLDEGRHERPRALAPAIRDVVLHYRRHGHS